MKNVVSIRKIIYKSLKIHLLLIHHYQCIITDSVTFFIRHSSFDELRNCSEKRDTHTCTYKNNSKSSTWLRETASFVGSLLTCKLLFAAFVVAFAERHFCSRRRRRRRCRFLLSRISSWELHFICKSLVAHGGSRITLPLLAATVCVWVYSYWLSVCAWLHWKLWRILVVCKRELICI